MILLRLQVLGRDISRAFVGMQRTLLDLQAKRQREQPTNSAQAAWEELHLGIYRGQLELLATTLRLMTLARRDLQASGTFVTYLEVVVACGEFSCRYQADTAAAIAVRKAWVRESDCAEPETELQPKRPPPCAAIPGAASPAGTLLSRSPPCALCGRNSLFETQVSKVLQARAVREAESGGRCVIEPLELDGPSAGEPAGPVRRARLAGGAADDECARHGAAPQGTGLVGGRGEPDAVRDTMRHFCQSISATVCQLPHQLAL